MKTSILIFSIIFLASISGIAQDIKLTPPDLNDPVLKALNERHSTRSFATTPIPVEELSNILWAGFGINRLESSKRTAPSSHNVQDIDIYVLMEDGSYLYNAKNSLLTKINDTDLRPYTAKQEYVNDVPVHLLFVTNYEKWGDRGGEKKEIYAMSSAAFIAENVFIYCSSIEMGCIIRAYIDYEGLSKGLGLLENQQIMLTQAIGYPKAD